MEDLISRRDTLDAIKSIPDYDDGIAFETISHALRNIELLPTIDAVPMIRCKDCVSWDTSWKPVRAIEGAYWCSEHDIYMSADDYCSMAERREE